MLQFLSTMAKQSSFREKLVSKDVKVVIKSG